MSGVRPHVDVLPNWKRDVFLKSGWLLTPLIGAGVVLGVRVIRYHASGSAMISDVPEITTAIEVGASIVLSFLILLLFPFRGARYVLLLLVAIGAMTTAMHNGVHAKPDIFALLFSPQWTEEVIAATEPSSLLVLDQVIPIELGGEEKKAAPTVRRAGKI